MLYLFFHLCSALIDFSYIPMTGTPPSQRVYSVLSYSSFQSSLILFGGNSYNTQLNDLWSFNISSSFWSRVSPLTLTVPGKAHSDARQEHGGFASHFSSLFYVFGGVTQLGPQNDLWVFDFSSQTWELIRTKNPPSPRSDFGYVNFDDGVNEYFAVYGGLTPNGEDNNLYVYDLGRLNLTRLEWTKLPQNGDLPMPTEGSVLGLYMNAFYVAGGYSSSQLDYAGFFKYDLASQMWINITTNSPAVYPSMYLLTPFIFDNFFYLIFGWLNVQQGDSGIIYRVPLNTTNYAWELFKDYPIYMRDSYAMAIVNHSAYIFGGYIGDTNKNSNDLLLLSLPSGSITSLTSDMQVPAARYSESFSLINGQLYMFGGIDSGTMMSDLWSYDPETSVWTSLPLNGNAPSARFGHATDSDGLALALWGGQSANGLENDLYIMNAKNNYWTLLQPKGSEQPEPAVGACLVLSLPNIYIFGGIKSYGISGELWQFSINSFEYTRLSTNFNYQVAYATCYLRNNVFYIMNGYGDSNNPFGEISGYDLIAGSWTDFFSPSTDGTSLDNNTAQGLQVFMNNAFIRIGGQSWGLNLESCISITNTSGLFYLENLAHYIYASGFVYYKSSLFSFGGGAMLGQAMLMTVASTDFFQLDMKTVCANGACEVVCSPGTYMDGGACAKCPAGTYAEGLGNTQCQLCPAGTMSRYSAATSRRQCLPCPTNTFSNTTGATYCLACLSGYECPVGSREPLNPLLKTLDSSQQPPLYASNDQGTTFNYELAVGTVGLAFTILVLTIYKLRNKVAALDLYNSSHNYELRVPMVLDNTTIGGVFSLVFYFLAFIIVGTTIIGYQLTNVVESKALVPIVVLDSQVTSFVASLLTITSTFQRYGDQCVINNHCSPSINYTYSSFHCDSAYITCDFSPDRSCIVAFTCTGAILRSGAFLQITLFEPASYATGIAVNVTSSSSIPGYTSSIFTILNAESNFVFVGANPSVFYFSMTPSLFQSQSASWPAQETGYHVSKDQAPDLGSAYQSDDLAIVSELQVTVNLIKSITVLYTVRSLAQSLMLLFSSLIGSVFGIMGGVGQLMNVVEGYMIEKRKKMKKVKSFNILMESRERIETQINDFVDKFSNKKSMAYDDSNEFIRL
jgi:hypothetical protein